jgi:uncharacterized membrane protein
MRRHPPWLAVVLVGAVIGLVFAAISTYDFVQHLDRQVHNLHCSFIPGVSQGGESGCQVAMMSPYSSVLRGTVWGGIPISLPAMSVFAFLAFYALDLLLTRRKGDPRATGLLALAAALPAATSLVMLAISLAELGTTCKLCVGIYVASALCLVGALALWRRAVRERGAGSSEADEDRDIDRRGRHHDEPAFVGTAKSDTGARLIAVVETGPVSTGFLAAMVGLGVAFVALPVVLYLATAPDHARFIGTCEGLVRPDDSYGVMVRIEPARGGPASGPAPVPAIEVLDPLCPACRAFEQRLAASGLAGRLDRKAVLFPLDSTCNWMVTEATHPGACTISEAVLCAGDRAPQVIAWAFETQDRIRSETRADPTAAARIVKQRFPELASCIGSPDARSRLNKSMRWIVANNIRVLTPQLFVNGVKLCDEDVDLGLEYTLSNMLERHERGALAVVPLEKAPGAPDAAGSAATAAEPTDQRPLDRAAGSPPAGASETPARGTEKTPPAPGNAAPGTAEGAPDQPAARGAATDQPATDRPAPDRPASDGAPGKQTADRPASDGAAPRKPAASDGAAPGQPAPDRPAADGAAPAKPAPERPASDGAAPKPAPERPAPDEPAPPAPAAPSAPAPPAPAPERPPTGSDQAPASPPAGPVTRPGDAP